jgi:tetratricopeptide (TPR) repeat protein
MTDQDRPPGPGALALPHLPPLLPDPSSLGVLAGEDLGARFRQLQEVVRRRAEEESAPSTLLLPDFATLSAEDSLDLGEEGEDLLEDARANIARGEYALALQQLAEFLDLSPGHPEARYLQAYCHHRLGGPGLVTALEILLPMRHEPPEDPALRTGVRELRDELRRVLTPREITAFFDAYPHDPEPAADRLRRFGELVPEEPEPPYLLAVTQALEGEQEAALRTARAGLDQAEGDVAALRALTDALTAVVLRSLAGGAVRALRDGAYRRARRELAGLDREWRDTELLRDFDAFLADLGRRAHPPAKPLPAPRGPADRVTRLCALISDEGGREAVELLNAGRFADAERVLARTLHLVPEFPPPNYLYAFCLCIQGREPERAIAAAEIAARDPALPDVDLLLATARQLHETATISAAVSEHNDALAAVGDEPTRQQLLALRRTMEGLRERVPALRSVATARQNAKRVSELADAVERRLVEVDQALENMEVSELVRRFNRWAERAVAARSFPDLLRWSALDGLPGGSAVADTRELAEIARQARRLRGTTGNPRARRVLQDLLDTADRFTG